MVRFVRRKRPRTLIDRGSQEHCCPITYARESRVDDKIDRFRSRSHQSCFRRPRNGHRFSIKTSITRIRGRWVGQLALVWGVFYLGNPRNERYLKRFGPSEGVAERPRAERNWY